jgi:extradiol dioxygenase family protein
MQTRFHLSLHVGDLALARDFYGRVLGCTEGRSADSWVDFDFFGHQLSLHLGQPVPTQRTARVGDLWVPMPHFGAILMEPQWQALAQRLQHAQLAFLIQPQLRFAGQPGEQSIMFFEDPFGNAIEIKGFKTEQGLFAT